MNQKFQTSWLSSLPFTIPQCCEHLNHIILIHNIQITPRKVVCQVFGGQKECFELIRLCQSEAIMVRLSSIRS